MISEISLASLGIALASLFLDDKTIDQHIALSSTSQSEPIYEHALNKTSFALNPSIFSQSISHPNPVYTSKYNSVVLQKQALQFYASPVTQYASPTPKKQLLTGRGDGDKPPDDYFFDWLKKEQYRYQAEQREKRRISETDCLLEQLIKILDQCYDSRGRLSMVFSEAHFYAFDDNINIAGVSNLSILSKHRDIIETALAQNGYSPFADLDVCQQFTNQIVLENFFAALRKRLTLEQLYHMLFYLEYQTQLAIQQLIESDMSPSGEASFALLRALIVGIGGKNCRACRTDDFISGWTETFNRLLFHSDSIFFPNKHDLVRAARTSQLTKLINEYLSPDQRLILLRAYRKAKP